MSGDSNPENNRPGPEQELPGAGASDQPRPETGGPDPHGAGAGGEKPLGADAVPPQSGPRSYVDPSIAADARIIEIEAELKDMHDRYLRVAADNQNLIKRSEREKADTAKYAISNFARDMLSVGDNLQRAIAAVASTGEERVGALKALIDGVELTQQELKNAMERHGVRVIPADGQLFDPHVHQAVMEQENKDVAAGTILQVFQEGYQIEGRVLRPTMVVVARGGSKPVKPAPADAAGAQPASGPGDSTEKAQTESGDPDATAG